MCGLFGHSMRREFIEQLSVHKLVAMNTILATSMDRRGGDGWGHADFDVTLRDPLIYKGLQYITPQITTTLASQTQSRIGHTRKKTHGATSIRNSHPFITGNIIGAHNGIINNHNEIAQELEVNVEVDSEVIFHAINKKFDLSRISGYGAIVYADLLSPGTIYLGRFNNGQLAIWGVGNDKDHPDMVIWASTRDAVETALAAADLVGFPYAVDDSKLYYIQGGKLYTNNESLPIGNRSTVVSKTHYYGGKGRMEDEWRHYWEELYAPNSREHVIKDILLNGSADETNDTPPDTDKKKGSFLESGIDGDPTLTQLWTRFVATNLEFPTFLAAASEAVCEMCPKDEPWFWFDSAANLFLCSYCSIETEVDVEECLNVRDVKRLAWSYAQQKAAENLKSGWSDKTLT